MVRRRCERWQWFRPWRWKIQLGADRLERIEPRGERVRIIVNRLSQVLVERAGLVFGQIQRHNPLDMGTLVR
jgi:hypothetical protein